MSRAMPAFLTFLSLQDIRGRSRRIGRRNGILSRGEDAPPTSRELACLPSPEHQEAIRDRISI